MSDQDRDIIDTIAEALTPWEQRTDESHCELQAREALTALRSAGYATVKLPEPDGLVVAARDGLVRFSRRAHSCAYYTYDSDETSYRPDQARVIAAALLAAADAAEADQ